jgi:hypothetical protein
MCVMAFYGFVATLQGYELLQMTTIIHPSPLKLLQSHVST